MMHLPRRRNEGSMSRMQSQTVLLTPTDEHDYQLRVRIIPVIPPLRGQHFAAKPASLVSVPDKASVSTGGLHESYGITEEDAARACVEKVEEFLEARSRPAHA
jgi:hypothetical protein